MQLENIKILGLSGASELTKGVCKILDIKPIDVTISHFADGEILVRPEEPVRHSNIIIIQSLIKPVNESVMELLICIDALKRASASSISVIIPYYAYARQDRKSKGREPITSKLLARLIETAGADHVAVVDVHSDQTQGFFEIPFDSVSATYVAVGEALKNIDRSNLVVVSPDYGAVKRSRNIAKTLDVGLAILDKRRPKPNVAEILNVLGDIENKDCLIVDDMIDTAGTIVGACKVLKAKGAKSVTVTASHGILSDPATSRLTEAFENKWLDNLYLTNSIPTVVNFKNPHVKIVDLSEFIAGIIKVLRSGNASLSEYCSSITKKIQK